MKIREIFAAFVARFLGGPNGLPTFGLRITEIQITSCLSKKSFDASHFCDLCRRCAGTVKHFWGSIFDFQIFWYLKRVQEKARKEESGAPQHGISLSELLRLRAWCVANNMGGKLVGAVKQIQCCNWRSNLEIVHILADTLSKPPTFLRHANVFKTRVSTRACPFLKRAFFARLRMKLWGIEHWPSNPWFLRKEEKQHSPRVARQSQRLRICSPNGLCTKCPQQERDLPNFTRKSNCNCS